MSEQGAIRSCFVPRKGNVFFQADYSALELHTLAQVCLSILGKSELAKALNSGTDPHTTVACNILGIDYEEGVLRNAKDHPLHHDFDQARQTAKVANFGIPGGLGAKTLVMFARSTYGVIITEKEAYALKDQFLRTWPEMHAYFEYVGKLTEADFPCMEQLFTERFRGGVSYCAAANGFFQGLGADCAKEAAWQIAKAQYATPESPLYGSRIVAMVHDEFIGECPEDLGHECATELSKIMVASANKYLPDVHAKAEPCVMKYWSKKAQTLRDENGRLIAWGS